jgi:hypothetical protein
MNRIVPSFVLAALLACTAKEEQTASRAQSLGVSPCGNEVISDRGIGELIVGRSVDSVKRLCHVISDTTELGGEGMPTRMLRVAFRHDSVEAEIDSGRVWRIEVASSSFRTADSLGVGTSIERLLRLREPWGLGAEGAVFLISSQHCGLSFQLSESGSDAPPENWDRAALARLPKSTVVDRVLIVGCDPPAS